MSIELFLATAARRMLFFSFFFFFNIFFWNIIALQCCVSSRKFDKEAKEAEREGPLGIQGGDVERDSQ